MELLLRSLFGIFMLSASVWTKPVRMSDSNIELMRYEIHCPESSTFYTPKNVKERCMTTAFACFMMELEGTASVECDDESERIPGAVEFLEELIDQRTADGHAQTNSTECLCENSTESPFEEFLDQMESLLHQHNSQTWIKD